MKHLYLFLGVALLVSGCSHTFVLLPDSPSQAYDDANREGKNYPARVIMRNGDRHVAHSVHIASDSTRWTFLADFGQTGKVTVTDLANANRRVFPTWDIRDIRITNKTRGTRDGAFLGTIGGVVVGTTMSSLGVNYLRANLNYADPATLQIVLDTFAGACIGALTGTLVGSTSIIRFEPAHSSFQLRK